MKFSIYRYDPDRDAKPYMQDYELPEAQIQPGMMLLDALLEGFAWDCDGRTYRDFSGLLDYAARVAGSNWSRSRSNAWRSSSTTSSCSIG